MNEAKVQIRYNAGIWGGIVIFPKQVGGREELSRRNWVISSGSFFSADLGGSSKYKNGEVVLFLG
jgi:hypothetical protein